MMRTNPADMIHTILVVAVCMGFGAGCAKIGEPQPPEIHVPTAATDLTAYQLADSVMLKVMRPTLNTDGSRAVTLAFVDLFRLGEPGTSAAQAALPKDQFAKRAIRILSIPASGLGDYLQGDHLIIQDKLDIPNRDEIYSSSYRYAVLFINRKNEAAGFSNQALIAPIAIPLPPSGLSATVTEKYIKLKWKEPVENMDGSVPPRIAGYKIYRAEGSAEFAGSPINEVLARGAGFEDHSFQFDKLYRYTVRTIGSPQAPYAESRPSEMITIETRDVFPPAPPQNFHAIRQEGGIILLWAQSPSEDVAGYRIFRLDKKSAARIPLQKELITALNYRDNREGDYSYAIQAVDTHGNESAAVQAEVEMQ